MEGVDSFAQTEAGPFLQALAAGEVFAELRRQFLHRRSRVERPADHHFVASPLEALEDLADRGCAKPEASADFRLALLYLREVREGAVAGVDDPPVVLRGENLPPHHPDFQDFGALLFLAVFALLEPGLQFAQFLLRKWLCYNIAAQVRQLALLNERDGADRAREFGREGRRRPRAQFDCCGARRRRAPDDGDSAVRRDSFAAEALRQRRVVRADPLLRGPAGTRTSTLAGPEGRCSVSLHAALGIPLAI